MLRTKYSQLSKCFSREYSGRKVNFFLNIEFSRPEKSTHLHLVCNGL